MESHTYTQLLLNSQPTPSIHSYSFQVIQVNSKTQKVYQSYKPSEGEQVLEVSPERIFQSYGQEVIHDRVQELHQLESMSRVKLVPSPIPNLWASRQHLQFEYPCEPMNRQHIELAKVASME